MSTETNASRAAILSTLTVDESPCRPPPPPTPTPPPPTRWGGGGCWGCVGGVGVWGGCGGVWGFVVGDLVFF